MSSQGFRGRAAMGVLVGGADGELAGGDTVTFTSAGEIELSAFPDSVGVAGSIFEESSNTSSSTGFSEGLFPPP